METVAVIDRIEEGTAYLQLTDGATILWPADKLPEEAKEGDALKIVVDMSEKRTEERKESIEKLQS